MNVMEREAQRLQVWGRYALWIGLAGLAGISFYVASSALTPVAVGWFFAYALSPLVDRMTKRGMSRTTAIILLTLLALIVLAGTVFLLVPYIAHAIVGLSSNLVERASGLPAWFEEATGLPIPSSIAETMSAYGERLRAAAPGVASWVAGKLGVVFGSLGAIVSVFLNGVLIPVFGFYFLRDFHELGDWLRSFIPYAYRPWAQKTLREIDFALSGFIHGQLIVGLAQGVLLAIGLAALRVELGIVIGLLAGVLSIIPYLGLALGIVLSALMALLALQGWLTLLGIGLLFFGVNLVESLILTPRFVGERVGLSPVAVIVSLLVFGEVLGVIGLVIAVPVTAVMRILWGDLESWYRRSRLFVEGSPKAAPLEDVQWLGESLLRLRCTCGGPLRLQGKPAPLAPPLAGAVVVLRCADCGRQRQVRYDVIDQGVSASTPEEAAPLPDDPRALATEQVRTTSSWVYTMESNAKNTTIDGKDTPPAPAPTVPSAPPVPPPVPAPAPAKTPSVPLSKGEPAAEPASTTKGEPAAKTALPETTEPVITAARGPVAEDAASTLPYQGEAAKKPGDPNA